MILTAFVLLLVLLAIALPVAATLGIMGLTLDALYSNLPLSRALAEVGWTSSNGFVLLSVPLFVMLGEVLGSQEALQTGLVDRVVPDADLQAQALALAQEFADGPTLAYGEIKRLFLRTGAAHLESQLELEAMALARVALSADAKEGIAAQVERRKPVFRGC